MGLLLCNIFILVQVHQYQLTDLHLLLQGQVTPQPPLPVAWCRNRFHHVLRQQQLRLQPVEISLVDPLQQLGYLLQISINQIIPLLQIKGCMLSSITKTLPHLGDKCTVVLQLTNAEPVGI